MSIQPVLYCFAYSLDFLRELVADVPPADLAAQPPGVVNHPAWTIGHLSFTCQMLGGVLGLAEWLPAGFESLYGPGSVPRPIPDRYEHKDAALRTLAGAQSRISAAAADATEPQLAAPFPDPASLDVFPTVRHALVQVLGAHTAYHVGQTAVWRRAKGLAPLTRSFE